MSEKNTYKGLDFSKYKNKSKPKEPFFTEARRKKLLVGLGVAFLACLVLYGGVAGASWLKRHPGRPVENAKPKDIAKFIVSDSFDKLRLSEKEDYLRKLRGNGPPPGAMPDSGMRPPRMDMEGVDRDALFEKMMKVREARMTQTARQYLALPKEQRESWIAQRVAEQEKRRAEMMARFSQMRQQRAAQGGQGGNAGGPPPGGGPGGPPPP